MGDLITSLQQTDGQSTNFSQWVGWVISQVWTAVITGKAKLNKYFNIYYGHQIYGSHFIAFLELNLALRNTVCCFKNDKEDKKPGKVLLKVQYQWEEV